MRNSPAPLSPSRSKRRRGPRANSRAVHPAEFRQLLDANRISQSFEPPRDQCLDNAVAESWFARLKLELIDRHWADPGSGASGGVRVHRGLVTICG